MADSRLTQLIKIGQSGGRNPAQETEYKNLVQQQQVSTPTVSSGPSLAEILAKQRAEQQAFLGRYTTGLADARTAAESELNLPQLRQNVQTAGQTARDVSRQVQDIAPNQQTIAKQVGISAPRLQQRIASETAQLQPAAETARRGLEDALSGQQYGETEYSRRLQEYTQPYQLEASMLSEGLAREFTGYTNQMQNELSLTLQKMANDQAISTAEIQRATELANAEAEFERQKQLISLQSQTGINQEQQLKNLGLGSYYQKPINTLSIDEWGAA